MRIKDLKLMLHCTPTKEVRYYLNGVKVSATEVVGSDGHRLARVETATQWQDDFPEYFIIPVPAVKALLTKVNKMLVNAAIDIKAGLYPGQYMLECCSEAEFFTPIDGKHPSFSKLTDEIKSHDSENEPFHQFNWSYLADAHKALQVWVDSKTACFKLNTVNQFGFFVSDEATLIIMPKRVQKMKGQIAKKQIVIIKSGWVVIGNVTNDGVTTVIEDANVIRKWGTEYGLGQIALQGPTKETILDYAGRVTCLNYAVLFYIDCKV